MVYTEKSIYKPFNCNQDSLLNRFVTEVAIEENKYWLEKYCLRRIFEEVTNHQTCLTNEPFRNWKVSVPLPENKVGVILKHMLLINGYYTFLRPNIYDLARSNTFNFEAYYYFFI